MTLIPELRTELKGAAGRHQAHGPTLWPRWMSTGRPRMLIASGSVALCLVVGFVGALLVSATSSTSPAYALTRHGDGTVTLKLYTLSRDIGQLNARLRGLGIDETVVPMVKGCPYPVPSYPVNGHQAITLRPNHYDLAPGDQGFIAARLLDDGSVTYAQGAMAKNRIPPCFGPTHVQVIPSG